MMLLETSFQYRICLCKFGHFASHALLQGGDSGQEVDAAPAKDGIVEDAE